MGSGGNNGGGGEVFAALGAAKVQLATAQYTHLRETLAAVARRPRRVTEGTLRWCSTRLVPLATSVARHPAWAPCFALPSPAASKHPAFAAMSLGAAAPTTGGAGGPQDDDKSSRVLISEVPVPPPPAPPPPPQSAASPANLLKPRAATGSRLTTWLLTPPFPLPLALARVLSSFIRPRSLSAGWRTNSGASR